MIQIRKQQIQNITATIINNTTQLGYDQYISIAINPSQSITLDSLNSILISLFQLLPSAEILHQFLMKKIGSNQQIQRQIIPSQHYEQLKQQTFKNEQKVLQLMQKFVTIGEVLSDFSETLQENLYPVGLYRKFRKIYEEINAASNIIHQYQSEDESFLAKRQQLINLQLLHIEKVFQNTRNSHVYQQQIDHQQENVQKDQLRAIISQLQQQMKRNDQQFSFQIQKYNNALFQMRSQIKQYQYELAQVRNIEQALNQYQERFIQLQDEKYRDEIIIDNMAKKIRVYEKQKSGTDAFLNPRFSKSKSRVLYNLPQNKNNTKQSQYRFKNFGKV